MFGRKDRNDGLGSGPGGGADAPDPRVVRHGDDAGGFDDAGSGGVDETQSLIDSLTTERDEARARQEEAHGNYLKALAEYQNYQRRALNNEREARRQGATDVITAVIPVLDHFDQALTQPAADPAAKAILDGVRVIRAELLKALESQGVGIINPQPNDEFQPGRHQALSQTPGEGVEPGRVSSTFQVGYELGERVVRPAKVAVAP